MRPGKSGMGTSGFAVLPRALDGPAVEQARALVDLVLREDRFTGCERANNILVPLRWDDALVDHLLTVDTFVRRVREATEATDLKWISGYVSVRDARTGPLAWHQDWWCWNHPVTFRPLPVQVVLVCYLCDVSEDNAALRVLPGSHRGSTALHAAMDELGVAAIDTDEGVTITARAGDLVVLDYRLVHGTTLNSSSWRRDAVLLSFAPHWRDLPEELRAHLVSHAALPTPGDRPGRTPWQLDLLPGFSGVRRDLPLQRRPPATFVVG